MVARSLCAREERIRDGKKEQDETKSKRRRRRKNRRRYTERAKTRDALRVYVYVYVHVGVRMYTSMCAWDGFDARKKDEEYEGEWWI